MFKNISGGEKKKNLFLMQISEKFIQSQDKRRGKVPHSPSHIFKVSLGPPSLWFPSSDS